MKNHIRLVLVVLFGVLATPLGAQTAQEFHDQGIASYQKKDFAKAVEALQADVRSNPQDWVAYQYLGNALYNLGRQQEALDAFDRCLALHSGNGPLRSFADNLRQKLGLTAPALPALTADNPSSPAAQAPPAGGDDTVRALSEAQDKVRASGADPTAHPYLTDFYAGKLLEEKGREGLRNSKAGLSPDEESVARFGGVKKDFYDPHFSLLFGILTPTGANVDLGLFLEPTVNLGLSFFYVPLPLTEGYYVGSGNYQPYTINRELIYFEPRIKWYSAPSGLTTYNGFSLIYFALHQDKYPGGYFDPNFDVIGLGYLFGFRTLPFGGATMELGFKTGLAVIAVTTEVSTETYNGSTYTYSVGARTDTIPFPYFIPEFRFGFTF